MLFGKVPMEVSIGGIYFPPILIAIVVGTMLAWAIFFVLGLLDWIRHIWYPPLFFIATMVICTWLVSLFMIPI